MPEYRENIELSARDFSRVRFWHWCEFDEDLSQLPEGLESESTYRAHAGEYPIQPHCTGYAAALATFRDGTTIDACAFIHPDHNDAIDSVLLLHPNGQVPIDRRILGETCAELAKHVDWLTSRNQRELGELFPLQCTVLPGILPTQPSLRVSGFNCIHIIDTEFERRTLPATSS